MTSFAPRVTHAIQLHPFSARETPNSIFTWPYTGKELHLLPQKDIPVNYQIIISFSCGAIAQSAQ